MNLKDILAVSGYPGLYKFVSQGKNSIIIESLNDKKRFPAYSTSKVSALNDVAIFTKDGEVPLKDVFKKILEKEQGGLTLNPKTVSEKELKSYFAEVLPDFDEEKVYLSDIKKVFMWYNALHEADILNLPEEEEEELKDKDKKEELPVEEKPKPKKEKKTGKK